MSFDHISLDRFATVFGPAQLIRVLSAPPRRSCPDYGDNWVDHAMVTVWHPEWHCEFEAHLTILYHGQTDERKEVYIMTDYHED